MEEEARSDARRRARALDRRLAPARRRQPHGRGDGHGRRARLRRPEGADHRPRGPQHPRARAPDRRRLHHRRHAARGRALLVRRHLRREVARHDARRSSSRTGASIRRGSRRCTTRRRRSSRSTSCRRASRPSSRRTAASSTRSSCASLGRLRYRTSYGQNVLKHTLEVVHLGGHHGGRARGGRQDDEARCAAPRHRQGGDSHEVEGSHALISAQLARRCGESEGVVHAIEAHHYEVQPQTVEAVLLIAADAISASRPGARGESLENYIKRLEALEELATAKTGVDEGVRAAGRTRDPRDRRADRGRRRRRGAALARDRPRDRGSARVPGSGEGDRHPREPRDRGGEVDTVGASRAAGWRVGRAPWPAA